MTLLEPPLAQHEGHVHDPDGACCAPPERSLIASVLSSPVRVVALAAVAILLVDAGGTDDGPGLCVFRRCTGGYCPGCGLTRSAKHLSRGEVGAAWHDHPWLVLLAVQMVLAGAVLAVFRRLRERLAWHRVLLVVGLANAALSLSIWVFRLADGSIPRFF